MSDPADVLDRGIPDLVDTSSMPLEVAVEVDNLAGRTHRWVQDSDLHPALRARALLVAGDPDRAAEELARCRDAELDTQTVAAACWSVSRVSCPDLLDALDSELEKLPEGFLLERGIPLGTTAMLGGLLCVARGRLIDAQTMMATAVQTGDERAPVWGALARLERARVVLTMAHVEDEGAGLTEQAGRLLGAARAFFLAGAYRHQADVAKELRQPPQPVRTTEPLLGHLFREPTDDGRWTIGFGVQPPVAVTDRLGFRAITHLIRNRHRRVPAVELERVLEGGHDEVVAIDEALLRSDVLLEEADLTDTLRDLLLDDRARSRVSKLLNRTVAGIRDVHPVMGAHLDRAVSTGYACRYEADPTIRWHLDPVAGDEP